MAIVVDNHPSDCEVYISKLCFTHNTSVHSSTGYSSFFFMFGHQAVIPIDSCFQQIKSRKGISLPMCTMCGEGGGLQRAYTFVREHCETEHQRKKALCYKKAHGILSVKVIWSGYSLLQFLMGAAGSSSPLERTI